MKDKGHFDKIANIFDTHFNVYSKSTGKLRVQRRITLFSEYCQLKKGFKLFEIGCGTGEYSMRFLKYDSTLFCTDISYNMLNRAINKIPKQRQSNIRFFVCNIEQLPIKNNIFDAIIGNSVLHHIDIEKVARQIFYTLKDGGKFAFSEPNILNPQIFLQKNVKFLKRWAGDSPEESAFNRWYIKKVFKKVGFRNVSVEPFDFLHPYTPDPLAKIINKLGLALEEIWLIKEIAGSLFITGIK